MVVTRKGPRILYIYLDFIEEQIERFLDIKAIAIKGYILA